MLLLFQITSLDNWNMYMEVVGEHVSYILSYLYFVSFVTVSAFFFLNLFIGILYANFQLERHAADGKK